MSAVRVESFAPPPVNEWEILRYAGMKTRTPEVDALLAECLAAARDATCYRVCWAVFPLAQQEDWLDLGFASVASHSLARNLRGCKRVVLFAATIGPAFDRLLARQRLLSPARAQMLQAIGAERVESLCDAFETRVRAEGACRPRFSPGYGDLPLTLQRDVMAALDCARHIGVSLNESLLMSPSKSVTALIGLEE